MTRLYLKGSAFATALLARAGLQSSQVSSIARLFGQHGLMQQRSKSSASVDGGNEASIFLA